MKLRDELLKEKLVLEKRIKAIDVLLDTYIEDSDVAIKEVASLDSPIKSNDTFPVDSSYTEKIIYIIKQENRFLHNSEIYNRLSKYDDKDEDTLKRRISAVLSHAKGEVDNLTNIRIGNSRKNTFWGSKDWLNEDGSIKKEYKYNDSILGKEPKKVTL